MGVELKADYRVKSPAGFERVFAEIYVLTVSSDRPQSRSALTQELLVRVSPGLVFSRNPSKNSEKRSLRGRVLVASATAVSMAERYRLHGICSIRSIWVKGQIAGASVRFQGFLETG